jgi:hypothetical protein
MEPKWKTKLGFANRVQLFHRNLPKRKWLRVHAPLFCAHLVKVVQETIFLLQEESLAQQLELIYSGPMSTKAAMVKTDPQKI